MTKNPTLTAAQLSELVALRHDLHEHPELSRQEERTASLIALELERAGADQVLTGVGGTGVVAVFDSDSAGQTLVLRCELDALPISEPADSDIDYVSRAQGVAHKCGHDGHMTILIGVAKALGRKRPKRGKVVLLFQSAEETGEGAPAVLENENFRALKPDLVIGFHNLPRHAMHSVCVRHGTFASASEGFCIRLKGTFSHSSYPEHGVSPALAMTELLSILPRLPDQVAQSEQLLMLTLTQALLGERGPKLDFGIAPGTAEICGVIRAHRQEELEQLKALVEYVTEKISERSQLSWELSWHEAFPATVNHDESVRLVTDAAKAAGLHITELEEPFRWSEDFSHYLQEYQGAFFGLGSGLDQPQLHNEYYDFPDELIDTGVKVYLAIIDSVL